MNTDATILTAMTDAMNTNLLHKWCIRATQQISHERSVCMTMGRACEDHFGRDCWARSDSHQTTRTRFRLTLHHSDGVPCGTRRQGAGASRWRPDLPRLPQTSVPSKIMRRATSHARVCLHGTFRQTHRCSQTFLHVILQTCVSSGKPRL